MCRWWANEVRRPPHRCAHPGRVGTALDLTDRFQSRGLRLRRLLQSGAGPGISAARRSLPARRGRRRGRLRGPALPLLLVWARSGGSRPGPGAGGGADPGRGRPRPCCRRRHPRGPLPRRQHRLGPADRHRHPREVLRDRVRVRAGVGGDGKAGPARPAAAPDLGPDPGPGRPIWAPPAVRAAVRGGRDLGQAQIQSGWARSTSTKRPSGASVPTGEPSAGAERAGRGVWSVCGGRIHLPA